jgi:hypothetical protein
MRRGLAFLFWGVVVVVGIPVVGVVVYLALSSFTGLTRTSSSPSDQIDVAKLTASGLVPSGELARMFGFFTEYTDLQREEKGRELKGVVVQWRLPVYDVSSGPSPFYRVQTSAGNGFVGTFCYVKPQNENERTFLANLKTGDYITCKGVINGVFMRNIEIKPAIVVLR